MISRRRFFQVAGVGAFAAGLYTWRVEPHWLEVVRRPLVLANLSARLQGARLALLSDLHIGPRVSDAYLLRVFDVVRSSEPDLVLYAGDFTDYERELAAHMDRIFPQLPQGRLGTFGVLGNHDYGPGWAHPEIARQVAAKAEKAGVRVLRNQAVEVEGLQIVGLDDLWAGQFAPESVLRSLRSDGAALVLSHNPDTVDLPGWGEYAGWIFAGHTHGGQCKPPFLPPPILPVKNRRYNAGEFALSGGRRMYISRGIGHTLKVRFGVRPEVTLLEMQAG